MPQFNLAMLVEEAKNWVITPKEQEELRLRELEAKAEIEKARALQTAQTGGVSVPVLLAIGGGLGLILLLRR